MKCPSGLFGSAGLAVPSQHLAYPSLPAVELRETDLDAGCRGEVWLCPSQTQYKCRLGEIPKELVYSGILFLYEKVFTCLENCIQKAVSE